MNLSDIIVASNFLDVVMIKRLLSDNHAERILIEWTLNINAQNAAIVANRMENPAGNA